jgi:hypothetical protein
MFFGLSGIRIGRLGNIASGFCELFWVLCCSSIALCAPCGPLRTAVPTFYAELNGAPSIDYSSVFSDRVRLFELTQGCAPSSLALGCYAAGFQPCSRRPNLTAANLLDPGFRGIRKVAEKGKMKRQ